MSVYLLRLGSQAPAPAFLVGPLGMFALDLASLAFTRMVLLDYFSVDLSYTP